MVIALLYLRLTPQSLIFSQCKPYENLNLLPGSKSPVPFDFQRGGDLYAWYLNDQFEVDPTDVYLDQWLTQLGHSGLVTDKIAREIKKFERRILHDIR